MRGNWARPAGFLGLFGVLQLALSTAWSGGVAHFFIDIVTVRPAAWLARTLSGLPDIVADGSHLRSGGGTLNVLYGCEGTDVWMLVTAALLVAPIAPQRKLLGWVAGTLLVFALNQARVLVLFFCFCSHSRWFGPLHGTIAPLGVVLPVTLFFLAWTRRELSAAAAPVAKG